MMFDIFIASTAKYRDITLITLDKDFITIENALNFKFEIIE